MLIQCNKILTIHPVVVLFESPLSSLGIYHVGFLIFLLQAWALCSLLQDMLDSICVLPLGTEEVGSPRVVNVILPEHRGYFVQHLGYFLATFLLLAFIAVAVIVLTRRRQKRGTVYVPLTHLLFLYLATSFYNYKIYSVTQLCLRLCVLIVF